MENEINLLEEIELHAYRYMLRHEIAIITGADEAMLSDPQSDEGRAFLKGRLVRKSEFHDSVIRLSLQLSSPAMAIEHKIA